MERAKVSCITMDEIINSYSKNGEVLIKDREIFSIIEELKVIIETNNEMNYLFDVREDIISLRKELNGENLIIKKDTLNENGLSELTYEFINMIDEQGLVLILEPNNNLYIDIDYHKLINRLKKCSPISCMSVLVSLIKIQEKSIFDEFGKFSLTKYDKLHEDILIDTDFERDEDGFKYMCTILSDLECLGRILR